MGVYIIGETALKYRIHIEDTEGFKMVDKNTVRHAVSSGSLLVTNTKYLGGKNETVKSGLPKCDNLADHNKMCAMNIIVSNNEPKYKLRLVDMDGNETIESVGDIASNSETLGRIFNLKVEYTGNGENYYGRKLVRVGDRLYSVKINENSVPRIEESYDTHYEYDATEADKAFVSKVKMVYRQDNAINDILSRYQRGLESNSKRISEHMLALIIRSHIESHDVNIIQKTKGIDPFIFGFRTNFEMKMQVVLKLLLLIYRPKILNEKIESSQNSMLYTVLSDTEEIVKRRTSTVELPYDTQRLGKNVIRIIAASKIDIESVENKDTAYVIMTENRTMFVVKHGESLINIFNIQKQTFEKGQPVGEHGDYDGKLDVMKYFKNYRMAVTAGPAGFTADGEAMSDARVWFYAAYLDQLIKIGGTVVKNEDGSINHRIYFMYSLISEEIMEIISWGSWGEEGIAVFEDIGNIYQSGNKSHIEKIRGILKISKIEQFNLKVIQ